MADGDERKFSCLLSCWLAVSAEFDSNRLIISCCLYGLIDDFIFGCKDLILNYMMS